MNDQPARSGATGQQFIEGTPVYDARGNQIGQVGKHGSESGHLVLHKGLFFTRDMYIPLSAVKSADANAVHLNISREELTLDRYASPPVQEYQASVTNIDRSHPVQAQGRAVIEGQPDTYTQGTDTIEQHPETYTRGTDTIEPQEESR